MKLKVAGHDIEVGEVAKITVETIRETIPHNIQRRDIYIVHKTDRTVIIEDDK